MATAPESMTEAALGRSNSSMDARDTLSRSDSQRKSKGGGGRRGSRSGNDLFVCFAPRTSLNLVPRPVLSPARDKGKESRKGSLSSSIFSKAAAKKQGFEEEEPTSPKVTCIGQVRVKRRNGKDAGGGQQKEAKKESACSSFARDFSCFGLPCDSYGSLTSFKGDKKSSGAVLAKSLVLIQQETETKSGQDASKGTATAHLEQQVSCSCSKRREGGQRYSANSAEGEEQAVPEIPKKTSGSEKSASIATTLQQEFMAKARVDEPSSETEIEDDDAFEPEPPPPNALLLMRHKVEQEPVLVSPAPCNSIVLKRSTSAPAQCRSAEGQDAISEAGDTVPVEQRAAEDRLKPSTQKSFLKRCKSVSQSFTRSNSVHASATSAPLKMETDKLFEVVAQTTVLSEHTLKQTSSSPGEGCTDIRPPHQERESDLVNAALRKTSETEALRVSLDIVPETWLWESCTVVRQPRDSSSERRLVDRLGADWLDAELEASLWRSCKVAQQLSRPTECSAAEPTSQEISNSTVEWLDTQVEATMWKKCSLVVAASQHAQNGELTNEEIQDTGKVSPLFVEAAGTLTEGKKTEPVAALGRSCSVGSQSGKQLAGRGSALLARSSSVGSQREQGYCNMIDEQESKKPCNDNPSQKTSTRKPNIIEDTAHDGIRQLPEEANREESLIEDQRPVEEEALAPSPSPSPSSVLDHDPAPPPSSPAPAASETLLFLRYNLGAFRISLDAASEKKCMEGSGENQQKAMLKAMSHLHHEVGTYARLLKAASGKERASVSSAFRLQRCKSEPVRPASY